MGQLRIFIRCAAAAFFESFAEIRDANICIESSFEVRHTISILTLRHPSSHGTSNNIFTIKYLRIPIIADCNVMEFTKMFYINTNSFTQQFLKYCCVFPYFNVTVQKKTTWQTLRLFCMTVFSLQQRKWIRMVEHFRFWFHIAFCFPSGKKMYHLLKLGMQFCNLLKAE